jgi:hypothetical protein
MPRRLPLLPLVPLVAAVAGCATLAQLGIRAPVFEEAPGRQAEIRLQPPEPGRGIGGVGVRLWARVSNPNPLGVTLSTLQGTLFLDEVHAAAADLPLGLPLSAGGEATVPIDLSIEFSDLPNLAGVIRRAMNDEPIEYRLDGTVAVEAGRFGTPVFGPMTLLRGTAR